MASSRPQLDQADMLAVTLVNALPYIHVQEPLSEDGWGSWGYTDSGPGEGPVGAGLAPQPHRCVEMGSECSFALLCT